tara:strand:+ start:835 stop:1422 length:588 start_codon:yes stop_codon:yes gene_type:complete
MNVLKDKTQKLLCGAVTIMFLYMNIEGLEGSPDAGSDGEDDLGFIGENDKDGTAIVANNNVGGGGSVSKPQPSPKTLNMGSYDGICLKTGNEEYWMKSPEGAALVPDDGLYSYLSSQGPIKMKLSDQSALTGPPVDGVQGSPEKMFMMANNVTSPLCCPSTFSTSTGCVCTTKNQRDFVAARGMLDGGTTDESDI